MDTKDAMDKFYEMNPELKPGDLSQTECRVENRDRSDYEEYVRIKEGEAQKEKMDSMMTGEDIYDVADATLKAGEKEPVIDPGVDDYMRSKLPSADYTEAPEAAEAPEVEAVAEVEEVPEPAVEAETEESVVATEADDADEDFGL